MKKSDKYMFFRLLFGLLFFMYSMMCFSADYTLGPDDVIEVNVSQDKNLSLKSRELNEKGEIRLGYAGLIALKDLTIEQAERKIKSLLEKEYIKRADVTLEIVKFGSKKVKIYGEVKKPGEHALKKDTSLIPDVIGLSGGKTQSASNIAYIIRHYGKISPIKIIHEKQKYALNKKKDVKNNYSFFEKRQTSGFEINPGDFIFIPPVFRITVVGEVTREGTYKFKDKPDIVKAIASAQGLKSIANRKNLTVKRKTNNGVINLSVDYDKFIREDNKTFYLYHDDVIVVHETWF